MLCRSIKKEKPLHTYYLCNCAWLNTLPLVLLFSGLEDLASIFEGGTPQEHLIYYFSLLTLLQSVVWAISKYSLSLSDSSRTLKYRLHNTFMPN